MIDKNILIVDASATIRKIVGMALKFKGYNVTTKDNGKDTWDMLQKKKFDMVIMDVLTPTINGLELLSRIKTNDKLRDMQCVILAAESDEANKQKGMELGADAYLAKPFQPQQLLNKVEELIK